MACHKAAGILVRPRWFVPHGCTRTTAADPSNSASQLSALAEHPSEAVHPVNGPERRGGWRVFTRPPTEPLTREILPQRSIKCICRCVRAGAARVMARSARMARLQRHAAPPRGAGMRWVRLPASCCSPPAPCSSQQAARPSCLQVREITRRLPSPAHGCPAHPSPARPRSAPPHAGPACPAGERLRSLIRRLEPELLESVRAFDPQYANPCWCAARERRTQPCASWALQTWRVVQLSRRTHRAAASLRHPRRPCAAAVLPPTPLPGAAGATRPAASCSACPASSSCPPTRRAQAACTPR